MRKHQMLSYHKAFNEDSDMVMQIGFDSFAFSTRPSDGQPIRVLAIPNDNGTQYAPADNFEIDFQADCIIG